MAAPMVAALALGALAVPTASAAKTKPCGRGKIAMRKLPNGRLAFAGRRGRRICVRLPKVPPTKTPRQLIDAFDATVPVRRGVAEDLASQLTIARPDLAARAASELGSAVHASMITGWSPLTALIDWEGTSTSETLSPEPGERGHGERVTAQSRRTDGRVNMLTSYESRAWVNRCPDSSGHVTGEVGITYRHREEWNWLHGPVPRSVTESVRSAQVKLSAPVGEDGRLRPYDYRGRLELQDYSSEPANPGARPAMLLAPDRLLFIAPLSASNVPYYNTAANDRWAKEILWRETRWTPENAAEIRIASMLMMMRIEAEAGRELKAAEAAWLKNKDCLNVEGPAAITVANGASKSFDVTVRDLQGKIVPRAHLTATATGGTIAPRRVDAGSRGKAKFSFKMGSGDSGQIKLTATSPRGVGGRVITADATGGPPLTLVATLTQSWDTTITGTPPYESHERIAIHATFKRLRTDGVTAVYGLQSGTWQASESGYDSFQCAYSGSAGGALFDDGDTWIVLKLNQSLQSYVVGTGSFVVTYRCDDGSSHTEEGAPRPFDLVVPNENFGGFTMSGSYQWKNPNDPSIESSTVDRTWTVTAG